jgi:hypothetical protein
MLWKGFQAQAPRMPGVGQLTATYGKFGPTVRAKFGDDQQCAQTRSAVLDRRRGGRPCGSRAFCTSSPRFNVVEA